jgi:opacity protein-like surface antigen
MIMKKYAITSALLVGMLAAAAPAHAAFPVYPTPGTENTATYNVVAANTGFLRAIFVSKSASHVSKLGVYVNGVDRGLGLNNATATFGDIHNYGAITAGQSIEYYIFNMTTGQTYRLNNLLNPGNVQHFYRDGYSGNDFGFNVTGGYYGAEDLPASSSDYDYNDFTFVSTTGAIPEPATWAMMILGFGLIGGALRQAKGHQSVRVRFA